MTSTTGPATPANRGLRIPASWWMVMLSAPGYILISYLTPVMNPAGIAVSRTGLAAVILAIFVAVRWMRTGKRPFTSLTRADIPRIIIFGSLGFTAYSFLLGTGQQTVSAAVTSMLINVSSLVTVVIGAVMLGERRTRSSVIWLIAGFIGTVIIILGSSSSGGSGGGFSIEALWVVGSALALSAFIVMQQPLLERENALDVTFAATLGGLVLAIPMTPFVRIDFAAISVTHVVAALALGFVCTGGAYLAWAYALAHHGAGNGALLMFVIPVLTTVLDWLVFGKTISLLALIGGAITLISVIYATKTPQPSASQRGRHAQDPEPAPDDSVRPLASQDSQQRKGSMQ